MKINKINIIYKRSLQMRQYEPAEVSIALEAQVDPTDKVEVVIDMTKKIARAAVEAEIELLKKKRLLEFEDIPSRDQNE